MEGEEAEEQLLDHLDVARHVYVLLEEGLPLLSYLLDLQLFYII